MLKEMKMLKYFINHRCIHAPLLHMKLWLSLLILSLESMKVVDHFDITLGNNSALVYILQRILGVLGVYHHGL